MGMSQWNPPVITGPEMLTAVLQRTGHGVPAGPSTPPRLSCDTGGTGDGDGGAVV